jgi:hypothetical protein
VTAALSAAPYPATQSRSLNARTIEEVLHANEGRSRFLVEGLIHAATTLVYGLSETGKSWLMVDMITAIVRGSSWLGQPVHGGPHRCLVLPTDSEGEWEYAERLGDGFGNAVLLGEPPPVDPAAWAALAESARSEDIDLVVIDNLYSWAGAVDMNSNAEVAQPLACLRAVVKAGISVVLVHHTNSGGRKPAGVHAIPAFFRHSLSVSLDRVKSHGNDTGTATYHLSRDGGRVLRGGLDVKAPVSLLPGPQPRASTSKPKTQERYARALAALAAAPHLASDHARGAHLAQQMDDVHSDEAGRQLVRALRKKGLLTTK